MRTHRIVSATRQSGEGEEEVREKKKHRKEKESKKKKKKREEKKEEKVGRKKIWKPCCKIKKEKKRLYNFAVQKTCLPVKSKAICQYNSFCIRYKKKNCR